MKNSLINGVGKTALFVFLFQIIFSLTACGSKNDYSWTENRTIVHALGVVDDITYTNSREAMENSLAQGQTVFEVDFAITADDDMICAHDWSTLGFSVPRVSFDKMTKEEFLSLKMYDKYTTMCLDDILTTMQEHPDMYIVTDTKGDKTEDIKKQFGLIVDKANSNDCSEVLDRVIPQIYNEDMYFTLKEIYDWKSYIYTSYYTQDDQWDEDRFIDFAAENKIKVVAVFAGRGTDHLLEKANSKGIKVYVHTYNTEEERQQFFDRGFWGLYTDTLPPVSR